MVLRLSKDKQFLEFLKENYDTNVFDNILNHKVEQEYINSIISLESEYDKKEKLKNSTPNSPPQNSYNFSDERGLNFNYNYLSPKDRHSPEKNIISNFSQYNYNKAIKNPNTSYYSPSNYSRLNVTSANLSYGFINQDYHKNSFCYYYDPITYERKRSKETSIKRYDRCFSPYYGLNKSNEQSFTNTFTKNLRKNISACMNTKLIGRIDTDSPLYKAKFTNYTSKKSNYFDRSIQYGGPSSVQRIEIKPDYSLAGRVKNLTK